MRVKKFDCYKIECEGCCEILFDENDTFVSTGVEDEFRLIPYQEFLDMTLEDVINIGGVDDGNWYSLLYKIWVVCPECQQYHPVWYDRLYHILAAKPDVEWMPMTLRQLIDEKKVMWVKNIDYDDFGTECVYGSEEEILI